MNSTPGLRQVTIIIMHMFICKLCTNIHKNRSIVQWSVGIIISIVFYL